jgi:hypothetical protein
MVFLELFLFMYVYKNFFLYQPKIYEEMYSIMQYYMYFIYFILLNIIIPILPSMA